MMFICDTKCFLMTTKTHKKTFIRYSDTLLLQQNGPFYHKSICLYIVRKIFGCHHVVHINIKAKIMIFTFLVLILNKHFTKHIFSSEKMAERINKQSKNKTTHLWLKLHDEIDIQHLPQTMIFYPGRNDKILQNLLAVMSMYCWC